VKQVSDSMDKKEAQKNNILDPLTCCVAYLESTRNTLIEQSPHIAYAIAKTKQTIVH